MPDFFSGDSFGVGDKVSTYYDARTTTDVANYSADTTPWTRSEIDTYLSTGKEPAGKAANPALKTALDAEKQARSDANDAMNKFLKDKDPDCFLPDGATLDEATDSTKGKVNETQAKANKGVISKVTDFFLNIVSDGAKEGDTLTDSEKSKAADLAKKASDDASRDGNKETRTYKKFISRLMTLLTAAGAIASAFFILQAIADAESGCYQYNTSLTGNVDGVDVCHGQVDENSCGCATDEWTAFAKACPSQANNSCPPSGTFNYLFRKYDAIDVFNQLVKGGVDIADGAWKFGEGAFDFLGKIGKYIGYSLLAIAFIVILVLVFKFFTK